MQNACKILISLVYVLRRHFNVLTLRLPIVHIHTRTQHLTAYVENLRNRLPQPAIVLELFQMRTETPTVRL